MLFLPSCRRLDAIPVSVHPRRHGVAGVPPCPAEHHDRGRMRRRCRQPRAGIRNWGRPRRLRPRLSTGHVEGRWGIKIRGSAREPGHARARVRPAYGPGRRRQWQWDLASRAEHINLRPFRERGWHLEHRVFCVRDRPLARHGWHSRHQRSMCACRPPPQPRPVYLKKAPRLTKLCPSLSSYHLLLSVSPTRTTFARAALSRGSPSPTGQAAAHVLSLHAAAAGGGGAEWTVDRPSSSHVSQGITVVS